MNRRTALVLAATGAIGCYVGLVEQPTWQDAIERAQVIAGLVRYPPDAPLSVFISRVWNLPNQLWAVLMWAGISEWALTLLISGVIGGVSFQALGLTVLAIGDDVVLSCLVPYFIYTTNAAAGGVTYPVTLLGSEFTAGALGLSFALLAFACLANGAACGALLLGLLPAVHLTIGVWCLLIMLIVAACDRHTRRQLWGARYWGLAGAMAALGSGAAHAVVFPASRLASPVENARYLAATLAYWDEHRRPFAAFSPRMVPVFIGIGVAATWLTAFRRSLPRASWLLLGVMVIAGVVGGLLSVAIRVDPGVLGGVVWRAMPSRVLNLPILACMAMIVGVAARSRENLGHQAVLAGLVATLLGLLLTQYRGDRRAAYGVMLAAALGLLAAAIRARRSAVQSAPPTRLVFALRVTVAGSLAVLLLAESAMAWRRFPLAMAGLADRASDGFWAVTGARPGPLLTASGTPLIQLLTRRPVLFTDRAMDDLAYAPEAGPALDRITREVYGFSVLNPPFPPGTSLPSDTGRRLWETRTIEDWRSIAVRFGVTDVLTYRDWTLRLPVVAQSSDYTLYALPGAEASSK